MAATVIKHLLWERGNICYIALLNSPWQYWHTAVWKNCSYHLVEHDRSSLYRLRRMYRLSTLSRKIYYCLRLFILLETSFIGKLTLVIKYTSMPYNIMQYFIEWFWRQYCLKCVVRNFYNVGDLVVDKIWRWCGMILSSIVPVVV
jgi:hypothetical protein